MYSHVSYACVVALLSWRAAAADSLKDIDHVVLFMQENRAFDHYFGTMAGVRGFADPNVHYNNNRSVFHQ
jgi:phospholipase C